MSTLRNIKNYFQAIRQNDGILKVDQIQLVARAGEPSDANLTDGRFIIDSNVNQAKVYVNSTWTNIGAGAAGGASDWDTLYAADKSLNVNSTSLTFAGSSSATDVITITKAGGAGQCLQITNSGTGDDIQGTSDTWAVTKAGAAVFTAVTGCDTLTAAANLSIDANGAGTIGIGETSTGAVTITPALTAVASVTITGTADSECLIVTAGDVTVTAGLLSLDDDDTATGNLVIPSSTATTGNPISVTADDLTDGAAIYVDSDNGASFTNDGGYLNFMNGTSSVFKVQRYGATTIAGNAGTAILTITTGDVVLSDSSLIITDADNAATVAITNATITNGANLFTITADAITDKSILYLDNGGASITTGYFINCNDDGAALFSVGAKGATVIAGTAAGTDAFTITVGDLLLNDSDENIIESEDGTKTLMLLDNKAGVIAADKAVLKLDAGGAIASGGNVFRVEVTGTPASGAVYTEFDYAGFTDTHENVGVLIDASAKKVQALKINAAPTAGSTILATSTGVLAADKATCELVSNAAACNADSAVLRVEQTATDGVATCVALKQDDIDKPFITFESTVGAGDALEAVGAKSLTTTHFVMVDIEGVGTRYIQVGTIA